ncbi:MAG TPA: DoxX family protein [Stellaceae bacterium]|nr:DoxX family protein [Stellaceae bacterium]
MGDWQGLRLTWEPRILSVLRIVVGLLFMEHGLNKIFGFPVGPLPHHPYVLFSLVPGLAGILESVGGGLIVLGLFTRPVALILSGEMAFAYFMAHAPHGFFPLQNRGEAAVFYCFVFLYLFVAGGGAWGLDRLRSPELPSRAVARGRA